MVKKATSACLYGITVLAILGWWYLAFSQTSSPQSDAQSDISLRKTSKDSSYSNLVQLLSPLRRDTLHKALAGDRRLMRKMIIEWDVDAHIMEAHGIISAKRLSRNSYTKALLLARQLEKTSDDQLISLNNSARYKIIVDDTNATLNLNKPFHRFLPETYVSASFLLALADPKQIVAIPQGLREQTQLFPTHLTKQIPLDVDRHNSEKLYMARPDVAFVAHYSHPSTLQALQNQGVPLFTLKNINSISEIMDALIRIGHVINKPLEAELLKLFMEAAMIAIDNRMLSLNLCFQELKAEPRILFLNHYAQFYAPTHKTITSQLLQRTHVPDLIGKVIKPAYQSDWMIPIPQEMLMHLNPDWIIVSTQNVEATKKQINSESIFHSLTAKKNDCIFYVDEVVQQSPSQYIVLAYYDIFQALTCAIP